jgi:hypothetical protein
MGSWNSREVTTQTRDVALPLTTLFVNFICLGFIFGLNAHQHDISLWSTYFDEHYNFLRYLRGIYFLWYVLSWYVTYAGVYIIVLRPIISAVIRTIVGISHEIQGVLFIEVSNEWHEINYVNSILCSSFELIFVFKLAANLWNLDLWTNYRRMARLGKGNGLFQVQRLPVLLHARFIEFSGRGKFARMTRSKIFRWLNYIFCKKLYSIIQGLWVLLCLRIRL